MSWVCLPKKDFLKRMAYTALKQNRYKKRMFDSFVFLPLSTRAYFKGRAYIKIILKNHARSYLRVGLIIRETRYTKVLHYNSTLTEIFVYQ